LRAAFAGDGFVFGGEGLGVLFETFDAVELGLKRFLVNIAGRSPNKRSERFQQFTHERLE